MLAIGTKAPDFSLFTTPDQQIKLSQLKGKKVILAFYPADWSPVCGDQMALYNETLKFFHKQNAELVGISVDSQRARFQNCMTCMMKKKGNARGLCMCSTKKESYAGIIFHQ